MLDVHKEVLYHYTCSNCKKWWSVAEHKPDRNGMNCPHCGVHHPYKEIVGSNFNLHGKENK